MSLYVKSSGVENYFFALLWRNISRPKLHSLAVFSFMDLICWLEEDLRK